LLNTVYTRNGISAPVIHIHIKFKIRHGRKICEINDMQKFRVLHYTDCLMLL